VELSSLAADSPGKAGERPFPDQPEGTDTLPQIDHFLVLMMENHSYDNYLGMLGQTHAKPGRPDPRQLRTFTSSAGMYKYTARLIVHWGMLG
jgi:phospholipase C